VSVAAIKERIDQMSAEERFAATAYLQHLAQENDQGYQAMISERMVQMDRGRKITLEQARRIHDGLGAEGR
jgi:hypothetical protein